MIKTKNVIQIQVNIENCKTIKELKDTIQSATGDVDIVAFNASLEWVVLYIEVQENIGNLQTIKMEDKGKTYSLINVIDSVVEAATLNDYEFEGSVQEAFAEVKTDEPLAATAIIFDHDPEIDYLLTKEFKLGQLSTYDGLVSISTDKGLVLIEKQCNVVIDYSTYNPETGTVRLLQTARSKTPESSITDYELTEEQIQEILVNLKEVNEFLIESSKNSEINDEEVRKEKEVQEMREIIDEFPSALIGSWVDKQILSAIEYGINSTEKSNIELMQDILTGFDDIENDRPVTPSRNVGSTQDYYKSDQEINADKMKELLSGLKDVFNYEEDNTSEITTCIQISPSGRCDVNVVEGYTITTVSLEPVQEEDTESVIDEISIGDTVTETIKLQVALISFSAFDEYAAKHNIVGWDLNSPTTLRIKYMDGVTTQENITKFHEMMDSLDPGWIEHPTDAVKFFGEFHKIIDSDLVGEFLNRVNKHNTFVRENLAKMRSALLDMEKDFENLKDEVNLSIDWDNLTAFASKKERTLHRSKGVELVYHGKNRPNANVIRASSGLNGKEFYIPFNLITDEIREKYELDNEFLYIEDVPDFIFYEVYINGHVLLIEKTEL